MVKIKILCACFLLGAQLSWGKEASLELIPENPLVTESWQARISFLLPPLEGPLAEHPPLAQGGGDDDFPFPSIFQGSRNALRLTGFPIEGTAFKKTLAREDVNGTNFWRVTILSDPISATRPQVLTIGPIAVQAAVYTGRVRRDFFGRPQLLSSTQTFVAGLKRLQICEPPLEGRPAWWSGAIARAFSAEASLDANICTAGDPLIFSLEVKMDTDAAQLTVPDITALSKDGFFRVDGASLKSVSIAGGRRFTWRIRAIKAGTVEIPALPLAYFDGATRTYKTVHTRAIPVQVKSGAQVALGAALDPPMDAFPLPDGLDLDFTMRGDADFTLARALALATRAVKESEFREAATAYAAYLETRDTSLWAAICGGESDVGRHLVNLGGLWLMAAQAREAREAFARAEWFLGSTPATQRGLIASLAKLQNDPRAQAPVWVLMMPFFYRLNARGRIALVAGCVFVMVFLFGLAAKCGRGAAIILLLVGLGAAHAQAGLFDSFSFRSGFGDAITCPITATAHFTSPQVAAGEEAELRVVVDPKTLQLGAQVEVVAQLPPLATQGEVRAVGANTWALPMRFPKPGTYEVGVEVKGSYTGSYRGNGVSISIMGTGQAFSVRPKSARIEVAQLPQAGRPKDFAGAIGRNFQLRVALKPESVRPGDLVERVVTLTYAGYYPSNLVPCAAALDANLFTCYPMQEMRPTPHEVVWKQMIVPKVAAATNEMAFTCAWYDLSARRYACATSNCVRLTFVSAEKSSTQNTAVLVDAARASVVTAATNSVPYTLHFAPAATSPVIAILPPDIPLRVMMRRKGWVRVETPRAIGWVEKDL